MRCQLILSISDHPIQRGIRKKGGYPERDGGEGQVWGNSMKLDSVAYHSVDKCIALVFLIGLFLPNFILPYSSHTLAT